MKQMNVEEEKKVPIDFGIDGLPKSIKVFEPLLFREGDEYCCILGPSLEEGIYGRGATEKEAFIDWDQNLKERIKSKDPNDSVAQYVIDTLNTSVKDVW